MTRYKMNDSATLLGPFSQLLTMAHIPFEGPLADEDLEVINHAGVALHDGVIIEVGNYDTMKGHYEKLVTFEKPVVGMPGMIDAHTHICWAGTRAGDYARRLSGLTYQEIAAAGGGILDTVAHTRRASKEALVACLLKRLSQLLRRGITTCEVKSGYGLTVDDELKMLYAIRDAKGCQPIDLIPTCLAAHKRPPEFEDNERYLECIANELLPRVLSENLSKRVDIFVEEGAFAPQEAKSFLLDAKEMGFSLCLHADQFSRGGAHLAAEVHALSADHLEVSTLDEFQALKKAGVIPVILPGASLGLGDPFGPARKLLDSGLALVIASDWNPGSAPNGDLLTQAALLGATEKLTMAETLRAITKNAAAALSLKDRGVLANGNRGDLVVFPTEDYREILYYQGSLHPSHSVILGKIYDNNEIF